MNFKHVMVLFAVLASLGCKSRSAKNDSDSKASNDEVKKYEEFKAELAAELSDEQERTLVAKTGVIKSDVAMLTAGDLRTQFETMTRDIYSVEGANRIQEVVDESQLDPERLSQEMDKLVKYAAIRARVDSKFPQMKEDVYKKLFGRGSSDMIELNSEQFLSPIMHSWRALGSASFAAVAYYTGTLIIRDSNAIVKAKGPASRSFVNQGAKLGKSIRAVSYVAAVFACYELAQAYGDD